MNKTLQTSLRGYCKDEDAYQHVLSLFRQYAAQPFNDDAVGYDVAKEAMRTSEQMLHSLFVAMPDVVIVLDREGYYWAIPSTNQELLFKPAEELLGRSLRDIIPQPQADQCLASINEALSHNHTVQLEYALPIQENLRWFHAKIVPMNDDKVLWVARDITERKAMEEQLRLTNERLMQLDEDRTMLLDIVAHDLKNPLAAIKSIITTVMENQEAYTKQEVNALLQMIGTSADRTFALITDVLNMSAIESGNFPLNLEPNDVTLLVQKSIEQYRILAQSKNILIQCHVPEHSLQAITDITALTQILDNLLSNALKYSPHGSTVQLSVLSEQLSTKKSAQKQIKYPHLPLTVHSWLLITVQDEGPGVTTEDMQRIFGKFNRLSAQPIDGEHSTGLGLAIVKKLVEAMNGRVWCENEFGASKSGAKFVVALPEIV